MAQVSVKTGLDGLDWPFLAGTMVSTFLLGLNLSQIYAYFSKFRVDRPIYRWSIIAVLILDIVDSTFSQMTLWKRYGNKPVVADENSDVPWSFAMSPVICGITAFIFQAFNAHRIYVLSEQKLRIPTLVLVGALFQLGWAMSTTIKHLVFKGFERFQLWTYGVACWLGTAAATDFLITGYLAWILLHSKRGTRRTDHIIDCLSIVTVETSGLTSTIGVLALILFAAINNTLYVAPQLCLAKLYIFTFMYTLNAREKSSEECGGLETIHTPVLSCAAGSNDNSLIFGKLGSSQLQDVSCSEEKLNPAQPVLGGIHVCTTASLSMNRLENHMQFAEAGYKVNQLRPHEINGFTTDIVGGINNKQNKGIVSSSKNQEIQF